MEIILLKEQIKDLRIRKKKRKKNNNNSGCIYKKTRQKEDSSYSLNFSVTILAMNIRIIYQV